jgi:glucokinase-like ROK family protein
MDTAIFPFSHAYPRSVNKHVVLDHIRFAHDGISRADLARKMVISRAAISGIVKDLLAIDLVREAKFSSSSIGRRPLMLEINPRRGYVVGIDLGTTHLNIILADFSGGIVDASQQVLDISQGPVACLTVVVEKIYEILRANGLEREALDAVTLGVPGPVNSLAGSVYQPPWMPGWDQFPIRKTLQDQLRLPVEVANDGELGALGEWAYGAAQKENNVIYIKAGSGIGAGLLLNGQIYRGETGAAGAIGHITVRDQGEKCECGNFGCLETVAGGKAIAQRARQLMGSDPTTKLHNFQPAAEITAREVAQAAKEGDLAAQQIIAEAGACIGLGVASLINLINPGLVVIGGGLAQIGDPFLEPIRHTVQQRCLSASAKTVRITTAGLGQRSTAMGAVARALDIALHLTLGM